ncbi:glycosyltransferase family 2 protein [Aurantiacibacter luteus]|uniref:Glycosyl transferase n=1 Tax=Aurantiacibacter luteus TaxID=1581420 RepID=A0A0G9N036_9SPHN|nr:galactosyltransferase-related protein [Aurantiacibacter luteus]KLE36149.1 glycosyl transferase [Aurantiacibacter luteus]
MKVSICTLAHGRADHLRNLVRGLAASVRQPDELVISVLQEDLYDLPSTAFPIRQVRPDANGLSLSAARNFAARRAEGEFLIFLDVDCIPHPSLIGDYVLAASEAEGLFMGEVGYLPKGTPLDPLDFALLDTVAVKHTERAGPPEGALGPCGDYRCFWSLNFAMTRAAFDAVGGFDEGYSGYGGEDTDFGRLCAEAGQALWWVRGAKTYHQYHPHHMPPVHHIDSVIANARYFAGKWGEPTMQHWLRAFRLMGLAAPGPQGWHRLRDVCEADLALTRQQEHEPFASTRVVLEQLESRESRLATAETVSA